MRIDHKIGSANVKTRAKLSLNHALRTLCVAALFCLFFSGAARAEAVLTLEAAYELARQNSPQIAAQGFARDAAQAQLSEAKYYWAPKLSFQSQFGPMPKTKDITSSENDIWDNFFDSWGFTTRNYLEFWMPLFTSTKVYQTHELAKIGLEVEELRIENEILNVEYDVARAYFGLQLANAAVDVIQEAEKYISQVETQYQKLLESGSDAVKTTDQYRIDIAKANLYRLKNTISAKREYAERALCVHTKLTAPVAIENMDFDNTEAKLISEAEVLDLARIHRGDMKLLDASTRAADKQAHIEWLNWWPDLVLAGELNYKFSNAVPEYTSDNFYIKNGYNGHGFALGFILKWELDPVRQVFKVRQANAKAERTRAQRELAISGIELEVSEQYQNTANALANIDITYKSRRSAKRFLTQELLDYEAGDGDVNDMISALTTFIEQRSMYLQALHDFRVALVKLQKVTGITDADQLLSK